MTFVQGIDAISEPTAIPPAGKTDNSDALYEFGHLPVYDVDTMKENRREGEWLRIRVWKPRWGDGVHYMKVSGYFMYFLSRG